MNYLVYDCEILKLIPGRSPNDPNYSYCAGWHDHANMGISVIACYSSVTGEYEAIAPASPNPPTPGDFFSFELFAKEHDLVIGFNSRNFDDRLCAAHGLNITTGYDLLEEIRLAAYGSRSYMDCPKGHSYALGWMGERNGFPKTGTGELAPKLWQDGKHDEVIAYALNDVKVTVKLLELGLLGQLKNPNTGKMLTLRSPVT